MAKSSRVTQWNLAIKVFRLGTMALPKTEGQLDIYQQEKPF